MGTYAWRELQHARHRMRVNVRVAATVAAVVLASVLTGCAKRGAAPGLEVQEGEAADMGEDKMASGSSLARARRGLQPEEGGILDDVRFDFDSYDLSPEARTVLTKNTEWLKANARAAVEIEGHTDERGTIEYNLALGARRAKAVKDYLSVLGVEERRLTTISYGEELPVCRDSDEDCWKRNRRAHFVILSP